jgi:GTP-binding protein
MAPRTGLMSKILRSVTFEGIFPNIEELPSPDRPEYAFIGRSNVGKSSLINLITERKELAYTSGTPGKTRAIHSYAVNEGEWALIDLPGYGYAKAPKQNRKLWDRAVQDYLMERSCLICIFVLIDANVPPQEKDLARLRWLGERGLPFAIVFTKLDKARKGKGDRNITAFKEAMKKDWAFLPQSFKSSAVKGTGKEELLSYIRSVNESLKGGQGQ